MKEIKTGDKMLVPFKVLNIHDSGDYPYVLGQGIARIHASAEMLERFRQEAGWEKDSGKTYEDGMRNTWEIAKKIICEIDYGGLSTSELEQIFGYSEFNDIMKNYTPQEAVAKIAEWEAKQEIHVNDEVRIKSNGIRGVVLYSYDDGRIDVLFKNSSHDIYKASDIVKTGRTIDIAGLLAQIGRSEP